MKKTLTIIFIFVFLAATSLTARSKRVNQIPNGGKFRCANCHIDPNGGGPRNAFGKEVEQNYLDGSGNVIWGAALAALDSDGDGKTNGEELQDAVGAWRSGDANPGDVDLVSNPGDPNSAATVQLAISTPLQFTLKQNYPNPFNPSTTIAFSVEKTAVIRLTVYNALGEPVRELVNGQLQAGEYKAFWDGRNQAGELLGSGIYLAKMKSRNFSQTISMLLIK